MGTVSVHNSYLPKPQLPCDCLSLQREKLSPEVKGVALIHGQPAGEKWLLMSLGHSRHA